MKLEVEGIRKSYGKKKVLTDITFAAEGGQCIGFAGPNGCGKTTFLSILAGVERPDGGQIILNGQPCGKYGLGRRAGYLPQINPLPDNMHVKECLKLWCDDKDTYDRLVERYRLSDITGERIDRLSGGMKRRVALCCALASSPGILIMDEPTASLDIHYKKLIHTDMTEFTRAGGILILVTHERDEMDMCDTCYFIKKGHNDKV